MASIIEWFQNARGLADFIRSGLPWRWQAVVSNWLIWSFLLLVASLILLAMHYGFREKPKIDWEFLKTGNPLAVGGARSADGVATYQVQGVLLNGENVSGHPLHQIDGEITLHRDSRKLPLFVLAQGAFVRSSEIGAIPPRANITVGAQFRNDLLHWEGFDQQITTEQFLAAFGGFTVDLSIDGKRQSWSFSIDQLREAIEAVEREDEERWLHNPMNRPVVRRRTP